MLLALFVWSPVLGRLVAQYATKTPSYWRVFWLIPVGPICAYSTVWLTEKLPRRWMHLAGVLVCSALLALPGEWMFTSAPADETPFLPSENVEKVPQETLDFGERLTDGGVRSPVLACEPLSTTLRQVWPELELLVSRPQYILDLYVYRGRPKPAKICCGSGTLSTRVSRRQTASQRCWQNMAWNTSFSTGSAASRRTACCARAGTLPPGRTTMFS